MKSWQFWLLLALVAASFYVTLRIALGLQSVQTSVNSNPFIKFLSKL